MSEAVTVRPGKPGIVIFVAILQFFSSAMFFSLSLLAGLAILFGAAWGIDDYVSKQMSQHATTPNFSYGLAVLFGILTGAFAVLGTYFLTLGLGLLGGKKFAWYLQVFMSTLSTLGLLSLPLSMVSGVFLLPVHSLLNLAILILFFRNPVREFFRV